MSLSITNNQATQIVTPTDANLQTAFRNGVGVGLVPVLESIPKFDTLKPDVQAAVREIYDLWVAAFVKAVNLQGPLPVVVSGTVTVHLAALTGGGTTGSLTFTDGFLVAYVAPT